MWHAVGSSPQHEVVKSAIFNLSCQYRIEAFQILPPGNDVVANAKKGAERTELAVTALGGARLEYICFSTPFSWSENLSFQIGGPINDDCDGN